MAYEPPAALPDLDDAGLDKLRSQAAKLNIPTRFRIDGSKQKSLTKAEILLAYHRQQRCAAGAIKLHAWAGTVDGSGGGLSPPGRSAGRQRAFAFWYGKGEGDTCTLPLPLVLGLKSAVDMANFHVSILCYQRIENLPSGVQPTPCETYLPRQRLEKLVDAGFPIPILADFCRAAALMEQSGWFIDCDSMWLRSPDVSVAGPAYGHVFGSMLAGSHTLRKSREDLFRHWSVHYLREPHDELFLGTPFRFPRGSPVLAAWVAWLRGVIFDDTICHEGLQYNSAMFKMFDLIQDWGLEQACVGSDVFSPIPRWLSKQRCFRALAPEDERLAQAIKQSTCVNCFWQSSRNGHASRDLEGMEATSLWQAVLRLTEKQVSKRQRIQKGKAWPEVPTLACISLPSLPAPNRAQLCHKYKLLAELGAGTYGKVYRGEDKVTFAPVAIKVIVDEQGSVDSKEIFFLQHCQGHPNIVRLIDGVSHPFWTAVVFELATETLHDLQKRHGGNVVPAQLTATVAHHMISGLKHIHMKHVLHRDLHSRNILMMRGHPVRAAISDFGLSSFVGQDAYLSRPFSANITAPFTRAPEVFLAQGSRFTKEGAWVPPSGKIKYSASVDIWSWACIVLHCGTGNPLVSGETGHAVAQALASYLGVPLLASPGGSRSQPCSKGVRPMAVRQCLPLYHFDKAHAKVLDEVLVLDDSSRPCASDIEKRWQEAMAATA